MFGDLFDHIICFFSTSGKCGNEKTPVRQFSINIQENFPSGDTLLKRDSVYRVCRLAQEGGQAFEEFDLLKWIPRAVPWWEQPLGREYTIQVPM